MDIIVVLRYRVFLPFIAAIAWAQAPGPAVGARVPDFALSDQSGQTRTLESLMGPRGLMLVFYRSADW
jgi:hypothetical protein